MTPKYITVISGLKRGIIMATPISGIPSEWKTTGTERVRGDGRDLVLTWHKCPMVVAPIRTTKSYVVWRAVVLTPSNASNYGQGSVKDLYQNSQGSLRHMKNSGLTRKAITKQNQES